MTVPFNKPSTSISEQISILRERGLTIDDLSQAEHRLKHIGYYRLAGYWRHFQTDTIKHIFSEGFTFEAVLELYYFDRELRFLLLQAIESIEVSFRSTLSRIYGNIHNDIPERKEIAKIYGLPAEAWLHSWMQVISVLRNYCAHHSRLCFRVFSFPPKDMHRPRLPLCQTGKKKTCGNK